MWSSSLSTVLLEKIVDKFFRLINSLLTNYIQPLFLSLPATKFSISPFCLYHASHCSSELAYFLPPGEYATFVMLMVLSNFKGNALSSCNSTPLHKDGCDIFFHSIRPDCSDFRRRVAGYGDIHSSPARLGKKTSEHVDLHRSSRSFFLRSSSEVHLMVSNKAALPRTI